MARRQRGANALRDLLRRDEDRLDWHHFNFLENLFIHCVQRTLSVPQESGVRFQISREPSDERLCLLFQIDRGGNDPLVTDPAVRRPDYLVIYVTSERCLCTIVEMKGRTGPELERGCDQILSLRERLRREFQEHLPSVLQPQYQGLLLCPFNANLPLDRIQREANRDFVILPLQYNQTFQLFSYVSRALGREDLRQHYDHKKLPFSFDNSFLEGLAVNRGLRRRLPDSLVRAPNPGRSGSGVYINYLLEDDRSYAVLRSVERQGALWVHDPNDAFTERISDSLEAVGLLRAFPVTPLPPAGQPEPQAGGQE